MHEMPRSLCLYIYISLSHSRSLYPNRIRTSSALPRTSPLPVGIASLLGECNPRMNPHPPTTPGLCCKTRLSKKEIQTRTAMRREFSQVSRIYHTLAAFKIDFGELQLSLCAKPCTLTESFFAEGMLNSYLLNTRHVLYSLCSGLENSTNCYRPLMNKTMYV